jgi:hypothetical protein
MNRTLDALLAVAVLVLGLYLAWKYVFSPGLRGIGPFRALPAARTRPRTRPKTQPAAVTVVQVPQ